MLRDIKYAWRLLLKTPSFTGITIVVMAIGLGLSIYMFSIVNMLAYKQLDIPHYDRLVMVDAVVDGMENQGNVYAHDYDYIKQRQQSFEEFSAYITISLSLSNGKEAQRYDGAFIEPTAFSLFGGHAHLGRTFIESDVKKAFVDTERNPDHSDVVIISYQVWQEYYNQQPDVIGKTVQVNGKVHTVIGVMNEGFAYPMNENVWVPVKVAANQKAGQGGWTLSIAARLKPNVSLEAAHQELLTYSKEITAKYPESNTNVSMHSRTLVQTIMDNSMMIVYLLIGATIFIMALVITNVGNLMLARAMERSKEVAIRSALGAPRGRIIRQMLLETIIICLIGGFFGVILAGWGLDITRPLFQTFGGGVSWWVFSLGWQELNIALWIILATSILTGLLPAIKASNTDINSALRDGTRGAQSKQSTKLTKIVVSAEIFLSCTLLILAGVMIFGVDDSIHADYGFEPQGMLTARFTLNTDNYKNTASRKLYHQQLINLLQQDPAIESATTASAFPGRSSGRQSIQIEDMDSSNKQYPRSYFMTISNNYFDFLDVPLLEGRAFSDIDNQESLPVVIVSASFAKKYWPNESAIGKRIKTEPNNPDSQWRTIVGVNKSLVHAQPFGQEQFRPAIYVPNNQLTYQYQYVGVKTSGDPYQLQKTLVELSAKVDSNIPLYHIFSLSDRLERRVGPMVFVSSIFIVFGVLALVLAVAGIYGIMSRSVTQRTQEFGVRRALGAIDTNIYQLLLKQGMYMLLTGITVGAILGYLAVSVMSGTLLTLEQYYFSVTAVVLLVISITFVAATLIPAFKVLKLEPNSALRYE
ncbi:MAG: ABC transporter permease [Colwelliaceae bacterium]|nr:ABC transporter permease [Colwelliaceae bacterium]